MKKIIPIALALVLALTACGGSKEPAESAVQTIVPTAITVPESIEMTVGDEAKNLEAKVEPAGVDTELQYESSDEKVATVDEDGNVTAVAAGECVITTTIKTDDGDNVATETADSKASSKEDKQPAEDAAESDVSEEPELKGETTVTVKDAEPVEEEVANSTESKDEDTAKPDSNKKPDSKPDNGGNATKPDSNKKPNDGGHDAAKPAVKPDNGGNATKPETKPEPAKPAPEPEKPAPQPEVKPEPEKPAPQPEVKPEPPKPAPDPVTPPKEETTTPPSEENWVPGQDNGIIPGGGSTGGDGDMGNATEGEGNLDW